MNFILEKGKCFQELESMPRTISSLLGFLAEGCSGGGNGWFNKLSSGRLVKRACGLCVCLTGALMEVMSLVFWCVSNPVHSYVNVGLERIPGV